MLCCDIAGALRPGWEGDPRYSGLRVYVLGHVLSCCPSHGALPLSAASKVGATTSHVLASQLEVLAASMTVLCYFSCHGLDQVTGFTTQVVCWLATSLHTVHSQAVSPPECGQSR